MERIGVAIVGAGAVGCAVAHELAGRGVAGVFVLEREGGVGRVQSGRSSGVVHAGIYYAPGSRKAELCVEANPLLYEFCRRHGVAIDACGKLVVAASEAERGALEALLVRARDNGVPGVALLGRAETARLEPNVHVPAALHVPTTGIVDAASYVAALARLATERGATVVTGCDVVGVEPEGAGFRVFGRQGAEAIEVAADAVVDCAGLHADELARMVDPTFAARIVPLRGEYYRFNRRRRPAVWLERMNVYPVPQPLEVDGAALPMVGVHLTPTFAMSRAGDVAPGDIVTVGPEFARVSRKDEYEGDRRPASLFLERARRFFPGLELADLELDFTGIMASLAGGGDFIIERDPARRGFVRLVGIDSPGLTSSLAIARRVAALL